MKEVVPVPYPYVRGLAGTTTLCPVFLPLPVQALWRRSASHSSKPLPTALPSGPPRFLHSGRVWVLPGVEVQVHSLLAAIGLVAPLQVLHLLRGGFAHTLRPPSGGGPYSARPSTPGGTQATSLLPLCHLNVTLCFSLICSVWDSCGGTCLGELASFFFFFLNDKPPVQQKGRGGCPALVQQGTSCLSQGPWPGVWVGLCSSPPWDWGLQRSSLSEELPWEG